MTSVATDSRGDVIAAGHTSGTLSDLGFAPVGDDDAFVLKLDGGSGSLIWQAQIASAADDRVTSVRVDENDDVVFAGYSDGGRPFAGPPFAVCTKFEVVNVNVATGSATWGGIK